MVVPQASFGRMKALTVVCLLLGPMSLFAGSAITGRVVATSEEGRSLTLEIARSDVDTLVAGEQRSFRVSAGDLAIGYVERTVRGNAVYYNNAWHLEQIYPITGRGATEVTKMNNDLNAATKAMRRSAYVREGDRLPEFGMINQNGDFMAVRELRGHPFVMNFIFTRCAAPEMCPASSTRMAAMQKAAAARGLDDLHFVTISFDPAYDSPGILRQYAEGYGMDLSNFHLLTGSQAWVDDLLRQFGILTREEDGTINHTMATLLVDAEGRVAFRKEGSTWTVQEFLTAEEQL